MVKTMASGGDGPSNEMISNDNHCGQNKVMNHPKLEMVYIENIPPTNMVINCDDSGMLALFYPHE